MFLIKYFSNRMNITNFMIILFNMNVFFLFIYQNINFFYGLLYALISLIASYFSDLFKKNSHEVILIKDGNINFHELVNHYSYYKLINYLKWRRIKLNEVAYCIMKNNHLTIIKNKSFDFPVSIILDGKIVDENLPLINKNKKWLQGELLKKHLLIQSINYAYYRNDKIYFVNN